MTPVEENPPLNILPMSDSAWPTMRGFLGAWCMPWMDVAVRVCVAYMFYDNLIGVRKRCITDVSHIYHLYTAQGSLTCHLQITYRAHA